MSERWFREKRQEAYHRRAKREGYRARSAYKLLQIQERFHVMRPGDTVVDLGAAPGAWSEVAVELVGERGRVYGLDVAPVAPMAGAQFLRGDVTKPETVEALLRLMAQEGRTPVAQAVLSDLSPNLSGQYTRDQAESAFLCHAALGFADRVLDRGGNLVVKIFEGEDYPEFVQALRLRFELVKPHRPEATRKQSSEVYLVAKGSRGSAAAVPRSDAGGA